MKPYLFILTLASLLTACENDINEVNRLFSNEETQVETAIRKQPADHFPQMEKLAKSSY